MPFNYCHSLKLSPQGLPANTPYTLVWPVAPLSMHMCYLKNLSWVWKLKSKPSSPGSSFSWPYLLLAVSWDDLPLPVNYYLSMLSGKDPSSGCTLKITANMGLFMQVSLLASLQAACGLWPTITNVEAEDSICLTVCSVNTVACKSPKIAQLELATFRKSSVLAPREGAILLLGGTSLLSGDAGWGWDGGDLLSKRGGSAPYYILCLEIYNIKLYPRLPGPHRAFGKSFCT